jgi:hypothetical protein
MTVKELINIINIFPVRIIFDDPKDCVEAIMAGRSPLYFTPVEGKERKKYENSDNKSEFLSTSDAIHIIDLNVSDLVNIFECDGTGIYELTKERIRPYCLGDISEDIVFVIFVFLHEVGHWKQFVNMGKNVERYVGEGLDLEKMNFEKTQQLRMQQNQRIAKGSLCKLTAREKALFKEYMLEYRKTPKEKFADEFALENIEAILEKHIKYNN